MTIEAMAKAAFHRFHELSSRRRDWDNHPDEDNGAEHGRNTFREMAGAALTAHEEQLKLQAPEIEGGALEPVQEHAAHEAHEEAQASPFRAPEEPPPQAA